MIGVMLPSSFGTSGEIFLEKNQFVLYESQVRLNQIQENLYLNPSKKQLQLLKVLMVQKHLGQFYNLKTPP